MVNQAGNQLETLREEAAATGLAAEIAVREGSIPEVVGDHAVTIGVTVIVMGSHDRQGLHKFLMGSAPPNGSSALPTVRSWWPTSPDRPHHNSTPSIPCASGLCAK